MHEDELLAVYRELFPQYRGANHREWLRNHLRAAERGHRDIPQQYRNNAGYAVITKVQPHNFPPSQPGTPPQKPPFGLGEILVLRDDKGQEVVASGRSRKPSKWGDDVLYAWTEQDYRKALEVACIQEETRRHKDPYEIAHRYRTTLGNIYDIAIRDLQRQSPQSGSLSAKWSPQLQVPWQSSTSTRPPQ